MKKRVLLIDYLIPQHEAPDPELPLEGEQRGVGGHLFNKFNSL
jgi:hypothetical protein